MSESFGGVNMSSEKEELANFTFIEENTFDLYGRNKGMNRVCYTESGLEANYRNEYHTKEPSG